MCIRINPLSEIAQRVVIEELPLNAPSAAVASRQPESPLFESLFAVGSSPPKVPLSRTSIRHLCCKLRVTLFMMKLHGQESNRAEVARIVGQRYHFDIAHGASRVAPKRFSLNDD